MREIKFRGINKKKTWVYGDLVRIPADGGDYNNPPSLELTTYITNSHLLTHELTEVNSQTIGQYTGFKDGNGKEIYEGDILRYILELEEETLTDIGVVKMSECGFWIVERDKLNDFYILCDWLPSAEIIGNIYENVELMEAAK